MLVEVHYRWQKDSGEWRDAFQDVTLLPTFSRSDAENPSALVYIPIRTAANRRETIVISANETIGRYPRSTYSLVRGLQTYSFAFSPKLKQIRKKMFEIMAVHEVYRHPPMTHPFIKTFLLPMTAGTSHDTVWIAGQALSQWSIHDGKVNLVFATRYGFLEIELLGLKLTARQLSFLVLYAQAVRDRWLEYYFAVQGRSLMEMTQSFSVETLSVRDRQSWLKLLLLSHKDEFEEIIRGHSTDFIETGFWDEWWRVLRKID